MSGVSCTNIAPAYYSSSSFPSTSLYSVPLSNLLFNKLYSTSHQLNLPQITHDIVENEQQIKRSQQEDLHLSPSISQQVAASQLVTNGPVQYEPTPEQNYTLLENDYYQPSSVYYLNPQYYSPISESSGSSYVLPSSSVLEQYAALFHANHSKHKINKQTGLGRRIGELVTNSAERASKAFKSFSQLKLFNEIKPSRLLGLVSEPQTQVDAKTIANVSTAGSPANAWFYPAPLNAWSSYVPPSPSSIFYQQPVFVRTHEMNTAAASSSPVGPINSLISPSSVSPRTPNLSMHGPKSTSEYISPINSDFYSQKLPLENSPIYHSLRNNQPSPQYNSGGPSTMMPMGTSTTTVYHHFPGESNRHTVNHNQQSPDLFASPQTQFGLRVKPPKDFDFDGSIEDDLQSSEQDDSKMINEERNGGRNSNNDGSPSNEITPHGSSVNQSPWPSSSPFDEYSDQGNGMEPEMFNSYNQNNLQHFNRPYISSENRQRDNTERTHYRPTSKVRPFSTGIRRPMPLQEFDEPDNWYNTFFGSTVKPVSRFRNYPFSSTPLSFGPYHHHPNPSLLNLAASASTSASLSPESFMSSFNPIRSDTHSPNYFHFSNPSRPTWPYGVFGPQSTNHYYRPSQLISAATSVRPISMPFFPSGTNYFIPRFPRTQQLYGSYPVPFSTNTYQTSPPAPMIGPNPFTMTRYQPITPYSIMPASSSLYPVRVPFSPIVPMSSPIPFGLQPMASSILPAIATPPILRYRYGPDLNPIPIRRTINITKRAETDSTTMNSNNVLSKQIFPLKAESKSNEDTAKTNKVEIIPNHEEQNLATLYNAYQVLQKRMENDESEENISKQSPQPYYQYYIDKDTTTTASTTLPLESSELLDSSAKISVADKDTVVQGRSIKVRHVQEHLEDKHEKRTPSQIKQYQIEKTPMSINISILTTPTPNTLTTIIESLVERRKKINQSTINNQLIAVDQQQQQWIPLLKVATKMQKQKKLM